MKYQCVVKGTQFDATDAAAQRLPEGTVVKIEKVNENDTRISVQGTAASLERCMHDWFVEDLAAPFPLGTLLWFRSVKENY